MQRFIYLSLVFYLLSLPVFAKNLSSVSSGSLLKSQEQPISLGSDFEKDLENKIKQADIVGLSLAIINQDGVIYHKNFGYADLENKIPMSENSVLRVGEISELITASLVMQFVEKGDLSLEDPVKKYLPELNIPTIDTNSTEQKLTIRHLLAHYSGLPSYVPKNQLGTIVSFEEMITQLNQEHLAFSPGQTYDHSTLNYLLLGWIIERVSGKSFETYAQENLFTPLQMNHSGFDFDYVMQSKKVRGYLNGKSHPLLFVRDYPAQGMFSSVSDLSRFLQAMLGSSLKKKTGMNSSSTHEMLRAQFLDSKYNFDKRQGLAWNLDSIELKGAGRVAWKAGEMPQFQSRVIVLPDQGLAAVLLTNSFNTQKNKKSMTVGKILIETIQKLLEKKGVPLAKKQQIKLPQKIENLQKDLSSWAGDYFTPGIGLFEVVAEENKLKVKLKGMPASLNLIPRENGLFSLEIKVFGLIKVAPKELKRYLFSLKEINGRKVFLLHDFKQSPPMQYLAGQKVLLKSLPLFWKERAGNFRLIKNENHWLARKNKNEPLNIKYQGGKLFVKFDHFLYPLIPFNENEAVMMNHPLGHGIKLQWFKEGEQVYLRYAGLLYKKK